MDVTRKPLPEAFPCAPFEEALDALLASEAEPSLLRRWQDHREDCRTCRTGWELVNRAIGDLRRLPAQTSVQGSWERLERRLDPALDGADELDPALRPWFATWRQMPLEADPGRAWSRIEQRLPASPSVAPPAGIRPWPWALRAAAVVLSSALFGLNQPAIEGLRAAAPGFLARWIEGAAAGPLAPFLLILGFIGFGAMVSLASIPLLRRAMLEPPRGGVLA